MIQRSCKGDCLTCTIIYNNFIYFVLKIENNESHKEYKEFLWSGLLQNWYFGIPNRRLQILNWFLQIQYGGSNMAVEK